MIFEHNTFSGNTYQNVSGNNEQRDKDSLWKINHKSLILQKTYIKQHYFL